ncbi:CAP domain-containing protein [Nonomuraea sp. NPDC003804]|uniref:CAP domain-containing protein n=1 Tax=Nonomuraea sp. NPDC003804 TaxID=3154547 RepID=UPI0033B80D18
MRPISRLRQAVILTSAGAVALTLASTSAAQSTAGIPANTFAELKSTQCEFADWVYNPDKSAFPDTPVGRVTYKMQRYHMEQAVLCLVNEARARHLRPVGRRLRPLVIGRMIRGTPPAKIAAQRHADDAARLRWWGTVAQVGNCVPREKQPDLCDPHINPETKTTPEIRARDAGFGIRVPCKQFWLAENTYTGAGRESVTPRAAVNWWMNSPDHRANILSPVFTTMYVGIALGSADPADGSTTPANTYVQMFTRCDQ